MTDGHAGTGQRPVVVYTEVTDVDPAGGAALLEAAGYEVVVLPLGLPADASALPARAAEAVAAIVGFAPFGAAELDLFPRLRVVCTTSTGTDMVDTGEAARRGVEVLGLPGVATSEVAMHALTLMLAVLRELPAARAVVAAGGWAEDLTVTPRDIGAATLGLVGFGRIARETARLARPVFARILATDPYVTETEHGVELVGLDALLASADVVSLHLPSTDESRGLMSAERLARLRPGAVLVNVSRGDLVDSEAVTAALDAGTLSAFAADVLDGEPPAVDDPLRRHPRALVTPHVAFLSTASRTRYELEPARRVIAHLAR